MKNSKQLWIALVAAILIFAGLAMAFTGNKMFDGGHFALQYFAAGDFACGVFAAGTFAVGIFSIGIFSMGIFSIGVFNIGLYAIGIFMLTRKSNRQNSLSVLLRDAANKSRILIVITALCASGVYVRAQEPPCSGFSVNGGFGGLMVSLSSFQGAPALMVGGGGAIVFKNRCYIGGFGIGTSGHLPAAPALAGYRRKADYGGLMLGYLYNLPKRWSVGLGLKTGTGNAMLVHKENQHLYYDRFWLLSPEISISRRINGIFAAELALHYNYFTGSEKVNLNGAQFSGPAATLMLKFGGGYF